MIKKKKEVQELSSEAFQHLEIGKRSIQHRNLRRRNELGRNQRRCVAHKQSEDSGTRRKRLKAAKRSSNLKTKS